MRETASISIEFMTGLPCTMAGSPFVISLVMSLSLSGPTIWQIVPAAPRIRAKIITGM